MELLDEKSRKRHSGTFSPHWKISVILCITLYYSGEMPTSNFFVAGRSEKLDRMRINIQGVLNPAGD